MDFMELTLLRKLGQAIVVRGSEVMAAQMIGFIIGAKAGTGEESYG